MAAVGGFAGIMAATIPAVILRERLAQIVPLKPIRWISGGLLLGWGIWMALQAFGLA
jgi:putative Ca2+/H+ antiporter (TMEM165/GDT1 family)